MKDALNPVTDSKIDLKLYDSVFHPPHKISTVFSEFELTTLHDFSKTHSLSFKTPSVDIILSNWDSEKLYIKY